MGFRAMAKRVKEFLVAAAETDLWKKYTKLNVKPQIVDVRVRETREGYDIQMSMKVKL